MKNKSNFFIPAGLFLGLGIGIAIEQPAAGLFIGLGVGLLITAFTTSFFKKNT